MAQLGQALLCRLIVWCLSIGWTQAGALPEVYHNTLNNQEVFKSLLGVYFNKQPETLTAPLGSYFKLSCSVHAKDLDTPPTISWFMNDAPLEFAETNEIEVPMGDKEWVTTSELILPSVRIRDVGSYKCKTVAKGKEIFSDDTYVQLEGVYFQKHPESLSASLDKSVKLSCSFRARPINEPAEISWLRNGAPLESAEDNQSQLALDEKEWVTTSELIAPSNDKVESDTYYLNLENFLTLFFNCISSVDYTDVGHYKCVAMADGSKIFSNDAYLGLRG